MKRTDIKERRRRAAELYRSGFTMLEVAAKLGVSTATVHFDLKALGVQPRRSGPEPRFDRAEATSLRERGQTFEQIAQRFGVSKQAVQQVLARGAK